MPPQVPALTFLQLLPLFRVWGSNKANEGKTKAKPKERALRALTRWKSTDLTRVLSWNHAPPLPKVLPSATAWTPEWLLRFPIATSSVKGGAYSVWSLSSCGSQSLTEMD